MHVETLESSISHSMRYACNGMSLPSLFPLKKTALQDFKVPKFPFTFLLVGRREGCLVALLFIFQ